MKSMIPVKHCSEEIYSNLNIIRTTDSRHSYALSELRKDVETELLLYPKSERESLRSATKFAIFVVHNKKKPKLAELPHDTPYNSSYLFWFGRDPNAIH